MPFHRFIVGHVLDALRALPDGSVHCVVTSPPYWGLRDYGLPPVVWPEVEYSPMPGLPPLRVPAWEGQLGLEPVPEMYVGHLVLVFREVRRVLRKDGTLWLNIGDSYNGSGGAGGDYLPGGRREGQPRYPGRKVGALKHKDLAGIPWRVAFALEADGWWLRADCVWSKPNCLPESVKDRPTRSHEYVFLLTKSERYFYDAVAVREPGSPNSHGGGIAHVGRKVAVLGGLGRQSGLYTTTPAGESGRNRRSVWEICTEPFPGAHFATFPRALAELCIRAGTSEGGCCPNCGAPWVRDAEYRVPEGAGERRETEPWNAGTGLRPHSGYRGAAVVVDRGFRPGCSCPGNDGSGRCVVLDPFGGSGTTTLAAALLGRDSVYIDLKREYAEMALERCGFDQDMFNSWELLEISSSLKASGSRDRKE